MTMNRIGTEAGAAGSPDGAAWPHEEAPGTASVLACLGISERRLELLRYLLRAGEATVAEIVQELGGSTSGIRKNIHALERAGVLRSTSVRLEGSFRPVQRFQVDRERTEDIAWMLFDALMPASAD